MRRAFGEDVQKMLATDAPYAGTLRLSQMPYRAEESPATGAALQSALHAVLTSEPSFRRTAPGMPVRFELSCW